MPLLSYQEKSGSPIEFGDASITPVSRVLQISAPGIPAGLVWNRPVAVRVHNKNGESMRLPVTDVTRMAIWGLMGASLVCALLMQLKNRKDKSHG